MRTTLSLLAIAAAVLLAAPSTAQTRMSACDAAAPGLPLVGTVTEAETGRPLFGAVVVVDDYPLGMADSVGCYTVIGADEIMGGRRRVQVHMHRYQAADTVLELTRERGDTVHFALRPMAPGCCRLEGEWRMRLALDTVPLGNLKPRAKQVEGTFVFSPRLPPAGWARSEDVRTEQGRFDVDLGTFFGGPYAEDVSTTVFGPTAGDFFQQAVGEVLADDSVMIVMIPGMSHGGLSLEGTVRGDTVRGTWIQNAYCCGARGRFVMHRVPASPAGDSLIARGQRAIDQARNEAEREARARKRRVGHLRLRVWDEGTGRYAAVAFAAHGHETNPGGGTTSLAYLSGEDGWGPEHAFEPGQYDLAVYTFPCRGEEHMADDDEEDSRVPRITVTIKSGERVDQDIRLDLCSIKPYDLSGEDGERLVPLAPTP